MRQLKLFLFTRRLHHCCELTFSETKRSTYVQNLDHPSFYLEEVRAFYNAEGLSVLKWRSAKSSFTAFL